MNVALPPMAATDVVPPSVTPAGLPVRPTLTFAELVVRLLLASRICTVTAGVIVWFSNVLPGCCEKASFAGAPGFTVNELLIPLMFELPPIPVAVIVNVPVFVIVTLWFDNTPFVNAAVVIGVPTNAPVEVSTTLNPLALKLVTVLLLASSAVIVLSVKAVPAVWGLLIVLKAK